MSFYRTPYNVQPPIQGGVCTLIHTGLFANLYGCANAVQDWHNVPQPPVGIQEERTPVRTPPCTGCTPYTSAAVVLKNPLWVRR